MRAITSNKAIPSIQRNEIDLYILEKLLMTLLREKSKLQSRLRDMLSCCKNNCLQVCAGRCSHKCLGKGLKGLQKYIQCCFFQGVKFLVPNFYFSLLFIFNIGACVLIMLRSKNIYIGKDGLNIIMSVTHVPYVPKSPA